MLKNQTTIESLDEVKHGYSSKFDHGKLRNFQIIFGTKCSQWPFPYFTEEGLPPCDGTQWTDLFKK